MTSTDARNCGRRWLPEDTLGTRRAAAPNSAAIEEARDERSMGLACIDLSCVATGRYLGRLDPSRDALDYRAQTPSRRRAKVSSTDRKIIGAFIGVAALGFIFGNWLGARLP